ATNNSWGGGLFSQALYDAVRAHQDRGILFVAAAGNFHVDNDLVRTYPCALDLPNIICVSATDDRDAAPVFSNWGRATVHLAAPGVDILSTIRANGYDLFSGTSMATPHVSGAIALLYAQAPGRDWRSVKNLILSGGHTIPNPTVTTISGKRLDLYGSLTCS